MIILNIDVKKLKKQFFFEGKKGTYCELVLMENKNGEDDYGNSHFVCQGVSKEDREAGVKGPIVGNAKTFEKKPDSKPKTERESPHSFRRDHLDPDPEIPF